MQSSFIIGGPAKLTDESSADWIPNKNMGDGLITTKSTPPKIPITEHKHAIEIVKADCFSELEVIQMEHDERDKIIEQYEKDKKKLEEVGTLKILHFACPLLCMANCCLNMDSFQISYLAVEFTNIFDWISFRLDIHTLWLKKIKKIQDSIVFHSGSTISWTKIETLEVN